MMWSEESAEKIRQNEANRLVRCLKTRFDFDSALKSFVFVYSLYIKSNLVS